MESLARRGSGFIARTLKGPIHAGAVINAAFVDFFQDVARGHFIVLRLEQKYGDEMIRAEFERIRERQARRK